MEADLERLDRCVSRVHGSRLSMVRKKHYQGAKKNVSLKGSSEPNAVQKSKRGKKYDGANFWCSETGLC